MRVMNVEARMQKIWDDYNLEGDRSSQVLSLKKLVYCLKDERDFWISEYVTAKGGSLEDFPAAVRAVVEGGGS